MEKVNCKVEPSGEIMTPDNSPSPNTSTVHKIEDTHESVTKSIDSIVRQVSINDITGTDSNVSGLTNAVPLNEKTEQVSTEDNFPDIKKSPSVLDAVCDPLFPKIGADESDDDEISGGSGTDTEKLATNTRTCNQINQICHLCGKLGHQAGDSQVSNNQAKNIPICQYCSKKGHTARCCYQLYPPANKNGEIASIICQLCKTQGHAAKTCPTRPRVANVKTNNQKNLVTQGTVGTVCQICKKTGHGAYICPYRHYQAQCTSANQHIYAQATNNTSKANGACHHCKRLDHYIRDCPIKQANEAQNKKSTGTSNNLSAAGASGTTLSPHPIHMISVVETNNPE